MKLHYTVLITILLMELLFPQTINNKYFEISGTINYSYFKNTHEAWRGENFQRYELQHIVDLQPTIGYFITPYIQLSLNPLYNYQYKKFNFGSYTSNGVTIEEFEINVIQNLGIEFGPLYNYQINNSLVIFGGPKFGLKWIFSDSYQRSWISPKWSKAQITLPIILVGTKYFFTADLALIMQLQYKYTDNLSGKDSINSSYILLGFGIATYL